MTTFIIVGAYLYACLGILCAFLDAEDSWTRRVGVACLWPALLPLEAIWKALSRHLSWLPKGRKLFMRRRRVVALAQLLSANVPVEYGHNATEPTPLIVTDVNYQEIL